VVWLLTTFFSLVSVTGDHSANQCVEPRSQVGEALLAAEKQNASIGAQKSAPSLSALTTQLLSPNLNASQLENLQASAASLTPEDRLHLNAIVAAESLKMVAIENSLPIEATNDRKRVGERLEILGKFLSSSPDKNFQDFYHRRISGLVPVTEALLRDTAQFSDNDEKVRATLSDFFKMRGGFHPWIYFFDKLRGLRKEEYFQSLPEFVALSKELDEEKKKAANTDRLAATLQWEADVEDHSGIAVGGNDLRTNEAATFKASVLTPAFGDSDLGRKIVEDYRETIFKAPSLPVTLTKPELIADALFSPDPTDPEKARLHQKTRVLAEELFTYRISDENIDRIISRARDEKDQQPLEHLMLARKSLSPRSADFLAERFDRSLNDSLIYTKVKGWGAAAFPLLSAFLRNSEQPRFQENQTKALTQSIYDILNSLEDDAPLFQLNDHDRYALGAKVAMADFPYNEKVAEELLNFIRYEKPASEPKKHDFKKEAEEGNFTANILDFYVNHSKELSDEIWAGLGKRMNVALHYLSPAMDEALLKIFRSRPQWQKEFPKEWLAMGPERLKVQDRPVVIAQGPERPAKALPPKSFYFQLLASFGLRQALGSEIFRNMNPVSTEFVILEPGEFTMGSPSNPPEEGRYANEAQHAVQITKSFEIAKTDVTQLQYVIVMGSNPSSFVSSAIELNGVRVSANRPVENVSWWSTLVFANRLSEMAGFKACYDLSGLKCTGSAEKGDLNCDGVPKIQSPSGMPQDCEGYRLPTEAEWEYAARAGTQTAYSFGNRKEDLSDYAVFSDNSGSQTAEVASKKPNPWGLYDMHGNLWQWVSDWYSESPQGGKDPKGADTGSDRVVRGGSWFNDARFLRSAYRGGVLPGPGQQSRFSPCEDPEVILFTFTLLLLALGRARRAGPVFS